MLREIRHVVPLGVSLGLLLVLLAIGIAARAAHGGKWAQAIINTALAGLRIWGRVAEWCLPAGALKLVGYVKWATHDPPTKVLVNPELPKATAALMSTAHGGQWEYGSVVHQVPSVDKFYLWRPGASS